MANGRPSNGNGSSWIWPSVVAGAFALINAFWVVVWGSITTETTRLQKEIDRQYVRSEESFTKRDNTEQYRQRIAVEIKNLTETHQQIIQQVRRLRDDVVSKDAYNGRHEALVDDIKRLGLRIEELRRDFGGAYTLSDKIKELQDQLKALQIRSYNTKPNKASVDSGQ